MTDPVEIRVPDIGDFDSVEVIEVLVAVGDQVEAEQSLITLESDKASMEIPSPHAGAIVSLEVTVGATVAEGDLIATVSQAGRDAGAESPANQPESTSTAASSEPPPAAATESTIVVPDIGDFDSVEVIEILVAEGDQVGVEQSLITLESDKASMEIPSTVAGTVSKLHVAVGDSVSQGAVIASIAGSAASPSAEKAKPAPSAPAADKSPPPVQQEGQPPAQTERRSSRSPTGKLEVEKSNLAHASPSVRKFARQLGVNLDTVPGSGNKGRILKSDVKAFVKASMEGANQAYGRAQGFAGGTGIPPIPEVDFTAFGETERVELTRINKLTAENLQRAWLNLPMVTFHDEADITELEEFRQSIKAEAADRGVRVTGLVFHVKALAATLAAFPRFNSSLAADGQSLIFKKYFNIGIAVDTPNGLVVPVLKGVDKKSLYELSEEMSELSKKARDKKLRPDDMQGASMTISSLGGIGGTAFTPIVNPPEVAILGISRAKMQPVWTGSEFTPRLMCPLDITYDHRVIDGADGARFMSHYCKLLGDVRRLIL